MQSFHNFVEINMVPLTFAYGLAYFAAGLAIALQPRRMSNFSLAHNLWLLGAFGIIHGAGEWGDIFIPIQSAYLSQSGISALSYTQEVAWGISFAFLLQFGISMIAPRLPWIPRVQIFIKWYTPAWSCAVIFVGLFVLPDELGKGWVRYMLAFPGAMLTAAAFLTARRQFARIYSTAVAFNLTLTATVFGIYAILGGLVVPERGAPLLESLNDANIHTYTGLPIQFWRMTIGVVIAFVVIRTLSIFDLEFRQRLEAAEKEQTLLKERQRIARDLHDGIVQSIYSAGLQLEVAAMKSRENQTRETSVIIRRVVNQLNDVIGDIRKYIFKLGPARMGEIEFYEYLNDLADEFTASSDIAISTEVAGVKRELSPGQKQNLIFFIQECLSNVVKHAAASSVALRLSFQDDALEFLISDNGVGIDSSGYENRQSSGSGLISMAERAESMAGEFSISQVSTGGGTVAALKIPYMQRNGPQ